MVDPNQLITISRNCDATMIPGGEEIILIEGTHVRVTQSLGGNFTILVNGNLVKVNGKDADALGLKEEVTKQTKVPSRIATESDIWDAMKQCYDPEIPVNIVDLGLIYDINLEKLPTVTVTHTLTSAFCPAADQIIDDIKMATEAVEGVNDCMIITTFDPPFGPEMMSEEARMILNL